MDSNQIIKGTARLLGILKEVRDKRVTPQDAALELIKETDSPFFRAMTNNKKFVITEENVQSDIHGNRSGTLKWLGESN
jgi:hypothetical protein